MADFDHREQRDRLEAEYHHVRQTYHMTWDSFLFLKIRLLESVVNAVKYAPRATLPGKVAARVFTVELRDALEALDRNQTGASLIEYALILILIAAVVLVVVAVFGQGVADLYQNTIGLLPFFGG